MLSCDSSGYSTDTVSLYRASLALCWLSALYIALCRLPALIMPIVLHWLPTTRFFISRAPNMITRLEVELQPLHWLPVLHIVLHWLPQLGSSYQELQIGSRFATPAPTMDPTTRFFISRTSHWK